MPKEGEQQYYSKTQGSVLLIASFELAYKLALLGFTITDPKLTAVLAFLCLFPIGVIIGILTGYPEFLVPFITYNTLCILAFGFASLFVLAMLIMMPPFYLNSLSCILDANSIWPSNNETLVKQISHHDAYLFTLFLLGALFLILIYLQALQESVNKAFRKMKDEITRKKYMLTNQTEGMITPLIEEQRVAVVNSVAPSIAHTHNIQIAMATDSLV